MAKLVFSRLTCSSASASACVSVNPLSVRRLTNRWVSNAIASLMTAHLNQKPLQSQSIFNKISRKTAKFRRPVDGMVLFID